eukprot:TRINITY_DN3792_c0_g3_i1.p1 TRINITY_DN3792_c0_g3~~TRINITY_DN3792_c0_g3_i1.p1  ORF type:complete len:1898 (+),score=455.03 TRINITY_DN3792_c0_g3_i1:41-5695(+)
MDKVTGSESKTSDWLKRKREIVGYRLKKDTLSAGSASNATISISDKLKEIVDSTRSGTALDLSNSTITEEDAKLIANVLQSNNVITWIRLDQNPLTNVGVKSMAEVMKQNSSLEYLNISNTKIDMEGVNSLFQGIAGNTCLRVLDVSRNSLKTGDLQITPSLKSNTTLKKLNFSSCSLPPAQLIRLADALVSNVGIESLDISSNQIKSNVLERFTEVLSQNLTINEMNFSGSSLDSVGLEKITSLLVNSPGLKSVVLHNLAEDPKSMTNFISNINICKNITSLDLSFNTITNAEKLFQISHIKRLSIEQCFLNDEQCASIVNSIGTNSSLSLQHLNISHNLFNPDSSDQLLSCLQQLTSLQSLKISHNKIYSKSVASFIKSNSTLNSLNLSMVKISDKDNVKLLMNSLSDNNTLTKLDISYLDIQDKDATDLVKSLTLNTSLCQLKLLGNPFVSDNGIMEILLNHYVSSLSLLDIDLGPDYPDERLYTKDFSNKKLQRIPDILFEMEHLTSLNLSSNQIHVLSTNISNLQNLVTLDLSSNDLTTLPSSLSVLPKIKNLKLLNNQSLKSPPKDVLNKTLKHILTYLRDLGGVTPPQYRLKLVAVGSANSGKTTLLRSLRRKIKAVKKKSDSATSSRQDGISIEDWQLEFVTNSAVTSGSNSSSSSSGGEKKTVTLNVWDFSRLEILHPIHRLFLTERSIFLIVFDLRRSDAEYYIDYWLQTIRSQVKDNCRILILGTHLDEFPEEEQLNELLRDLFERLKRRFQIDGMYMVNLLAGDVGYLTDILLKMISEYNYIGYPRTFVEFENMVRQDNLQRKDGADCVKNWNQIVDLGYSCNISEKEELIKCLKVNHMWGTLLWIDEPGLRDSVILDPTFVTRHALAGILTTQVNAVKDGVIASKDFQFVLRASLDSFTTEVRTLMLKLFVNCELALPIPPRRFKKQNPTLAQALDVDFGDIKFANDIDLLLFPSFISTQKPNFDLIWKPNWDVSQHQYCRYFSLSYIPSNFFHHLMVRMIHLADEVLEYWRWGILVSHNSDLVLVEMSILDRRLSIAVRGSTPPISTFRTCIELADTILTLAEDEVEVIQEIPCVHCLKEGIESPPIFAMEDLEMTAASESRVNNQWIVMCETGAYIELQQLAPDVTLMDVSASLVKYESLEMYQEIGKGAFGTIFEGYNLDEVVAIKTLDATDNNPEVRRKAFKDFRHEVFVMSNLMHPNLVKLSAFSLDPFAIIMEYLPYGNLYEFLNDPKSPRHWAIGMKIAIDIARGMLYMHTCKPPIVHRDLKSPNVLLLSTDPTVPICAKVADFGTGVFMYTPTLKVPRSKRDVANPTWLAPEIMFEHPFTEKSDIYSYGIILWEIVSREHPFEKFHFDFMFELEDAIKIGVRPAFPSYCPPIYRDLVNLCWDADPNIRPGFFDIIQNLVDMTLELCPKLKLPQDILVQIYDESYRRVPPPDRLTTSNPLPSMHGTFSKRLSPSKKQDSTIKISVYSLLQINDRQVWAGMKDGSIVVWSALSGQEILQLPHIHKSEVNQLIQVGETVWSYSQKEKVIKVWRGLDEDEIRRDQHISVKKDVKSGWLQHQIIHPPNDERSKPKRRWVVLRGGFLLVYKEEDHRSPIQILDLKGASLSSRTKPKFKIEIKPKNEDNEGCCLQARDIIEGQSWIESIKQEINHEDTALELHLVQELAADGVLSILNFKNTAIYGGGEDSKIKIWNPSTFQMQSIDLKEKVAEQVKTSSGIWITKMIEHNNIIWLSIYKFIVGIDSSCNIVCTLLGHTQKINDIIGVDGRLWSCSDDCTIRVWSLVGDNKYQLIKVLEFQGIGKLHSMVRVDNKVWAAGFKKEISVWDAEELKHIQTLPPEHNDSIICMTRLKNTVWAGSSDGTISVWF